MSPFIESSREKEKSCPTNESRADYSSSAKGATASVHGSTDSSSSSAAINGTSSRVAPRPPLRPVAICGIALRLPGGLESPPKLWDFLLSKCDARGQVPKPRYNIDAYHSTSGRPGTIATQYGYFLDESIQLGSLDAYLLSMSQAELEFADPQQRRIPEVVREALDVLIEDGP